MIKRILSALIIIPPLILLIIFGPPYMLYIIITIASILGINEFYKLTLPREAFCIKWCGIFISIVLCSVFQWTSYQSIPLVLMILLSALFVCNIATFKESNKASSYIGFSFFGIFFIPFLFSHLILLHKLPYGIYWVAMLVIAVWVSDTFALFSGTFLGKHRFFPHISPNKTVEGCIGCFIGALLCTFIFKFLILSMLTIKDVVIIGLGIGFFGQLGDLTESMIKRGAQVKDSGSLIPGHGGMLDRLDSLLFSGPFVFYYIINQIYSGIL